MSTYKYNTYQRRVIMATLANGNQSQVITYINKLISLYGFNVLAKGRVLRGYSKNGNPRYYYIPRRANLIYDKYLAYKYSQTSKLKVNQFLINKIESVYQYQHLSRHVLQAIRSTTTRDGLYHIFMGLIPVKDAQISTGKFLDKANGKQSIKLLHQLRHVFNKDIININHNHKIKTIDNLTGSIEYPIKYNNRLYGRPHYQNLIGTTDPTLLDKLATLFTKQYYKITGYRLNSTIKLFLPITTISTTNPLGNQINNIDRVVEYLHRDNKLQTKDTTKAIYDPDNKLLSSKQQSLAINTQLNSIKGCQTNYCITRTQINKQIKLLKSITRIDNCSSSVISSKSSVVRADFDKLSKITSDYINNGLQVQNKGNKGKLDTKKQTDKLLELLALISVFASINNNVYSADLLNYELVVSTHNIESASINQLQLFRDKPT